MKRFSAIQTGKALTVFIGFAVVFTMVIWCAGITEPKHLSVVLLAALVLGITLYWIGYWKQFDTWDPSWEERVLKEPVMILDCMTQGLFHVPGIILSLFTTLVRGIRGW